MQSKHILSIVVLLFLTAKISLAQSLTFCEKADATGKAVNAANTFTVAKNGGPVTLLFTIPVGAKPASVSFDVYRLDNGKEVFLSTIKQPVNGSQGYVAKQMTFYNEGRYRVYVFDEGDKQLARSELLIKK